MILFEIEFRRPLGEFLFLLHWYSPDCPRIPKSDMDGFAGTGLISGQVLPQRGAELEIRFGEPD
jgi:hypothetical protein